MFWKGSRREWLILAPALSGSSSRVIDARTSNSQRHPQVIWLPERCQARAIHSQRQAPAHSQNNFNDPASRRRKCVLQKLNVLFSLQLAKFISRFAKLWPV